MAKDFLLGDWMQVMAVVPFDDGLKVIDFLRDELGFKDIDWCIMGRDEDNARVDYDPCRPLTEKPLG